MPSADDRCASCACAPVPIVITSPIAEMPGTLGAEQVVDLDEAALEREAGLLGAEPVGHRAAAGRDEQLLDRQRLAVLPSGVAASRS